MSRQAIDTAAVNSPDFSEFQLMAAISALAC